jgi:type VI protein secretion system component VasF
MAAGTKLPQMAEPARRLPTDAPIYDSGTVQREYRRQRAKRQARARRTRERRAANIRFWLIVIGLLALSVYLSIAMWHQVQKLFGL